MNVKNKNKKDPTCLKLWHGTRGTDPTQIYRGDGLNINYANDGLFGKGIYFARNSNYSCPNYSSPVAGSQNQFEVFLASVIIGDSYDAGQGQKLMEPPAKPNRPNEKYDSVKGHTNGSDVYMVYQNVKTYPGMLVRYSI